MDDGLKKYTAHGVKSPFNTPIERQEAYRIVFGSELGSQVLQDYLSSLGYYQAFIPNANHPSASVASVFDNGKKFAAHEILQQLTIKLKPVDMVSAINNYDNEPIRGI